MKLSIFIQRPVLAIVMSLFVVIAGLGALGRLPIAQYPDIAPPMVQVRTVYPGASAEVVNANVASVIENAVTGVEDFLSMQGGCTSSGAYSLDINFQIGSNPDKALININNLIKQAEAKLPQEVRRQGITVTKGTSGFLMVVAFTSPDNSLSDLAVSNYVTLNMLDRVKRIKGVGEARIFGAKDYACRIWLRPEALAQHAVTVDDVRRAVQAQNNQFPAGKINSQPSKPGAEIAMTVIAGGRPQTAEEFAAIVVARGANGGLLRLGDLARVEIGSKDYDFAGTSNGHSAAMMGVMLQPGANALDVADAVNATVDAMRPEFPVGLSAKVTYETYQFIRISIREVIKTLAEAMLLVTLVVLLFLQSLRATLIPILAVPVSLIGTFALMHLLGYSINTLTLFGMVLSIGIVVDDAIVVLENVERIRHEKKCGIREATTLAMEEVTTPIIAIVLVLMAVFVPVCFVGGLTGELYRQFAVTIAISVFISGLVALSLTPALCVQFLDRPLSPPAAPFRLFNRFFDACRERYGQAVGFFLKHSFIGVTLFFAMLAATAQLWKTTPKSMLPMEDQGYFICSISLPEGATLDRNRAVIAQLGEIVKQIPEIQHFTAFAGMDFANGGVFRGNAGSCFCVLKPWDERQRSADEIIKDFTARTMGIQNAGLFIMNPPPIRGLSNTGGWELQLQNRGDGGPARLASVANDFLMALRTDKDGVIPMCFTTWSAFSPQLHVLPDTEKAAQLGVPLPDIFDALASLMGTSYVNDFSKSGRNWQVLMSAEPASRQSPEDIGRIQVKSSTTGAMIPLSELIHWQTGSGPDYIPRYNNLPACKLMGGVAPGRSSGEAIAKLKEIAAKVLPPDITYEFAGATYQENKAGNGGLIALGLAVLMMFLILAALYNGWALPWVVLLTLPFGLFGALAAVNLTGLTNDIYFQIGLITLLGLTAKNAILIVEFAEYRREAGVDAASAAKEAAVLRLRPILMTSLAFIFGVLPLAISHGAGAGARRSVGTGVMGGMITATFLALLFVPLFYKLVQGRMKKESEGES